MSPLQRNFALAGGLGIMLLGAACGGDGTGPGNGNPGATAAKLEALDDPFDTPTFLSFRLAAGFTPVASASLSDLRAALSAVQAGPGRGTQAVVPFLRHTLDHRSVAGSASFFPPEILGKTYEWNPTSGAYEVTTRAGAPADGVRFILYTLGSAGLPATPLHEIGYADFKDESTTTLTRLHIVVVANGTTYVDYTLNNDTVNLTMVGFVSDGTRRLDFGLTLSGTATVSSEEVTFDIDAENAHVRLTVVTEVLSETSSRGTLDYRFQFGPDVATLTGIVNVDGSVVSGSFTITLNGRGVATFTYNAAGGTWSRPGGGALPQSDLQAVAAIFAASGNLLFRVIDLLLL